MKVCSIQLELSSSTEKNETLLQIDPLVKESSSCNPVQINESLVNITPSIKKNERLSAISLPSKLSVDEKTVLIPSKQSTDKESLEPIEPPLQTNETLASMEKNLWSSVNEQSVNRETLEPSVTAVDEFVKQHDKEGKLLFLEFVATYNNFFL